MDQKEAGKVIERYSQLVSRALEVVDQAPYWAYVDEPDYARLTIDGETATLIWPHDEMEYDMSTITCEHKCFEARLLFISDEELRAWKEEQLRLYREQQEQRNREAVAQREAAERAMYENLKKRFG